MLDRNFEFNSQAFLAEVLDEARRARSKFPNGRETNLPALIEEVGEFVRALLQHTHEPDKKVSAEDVWREAIQTAAMACRLAVEGDARFQYAMPDTCHRCGCSELNPCVDQTTGKPCLWVALDLRSCCADWSSAGG